MIGVDAAAAADPLALDHVCVSASRVEGWLQRLRIDSMRNQPRATRRNQHDRNEAETVAAADKEEKRREEKEDREQPNRSQ